jgi:hypothetical protein
MQFVVIIALLALSGCASKRDIQEEAGIGFPLRYLEGRIEDPTVRLRAFADGPRPARFSERIGIVVEKPAELKGRTVIFRFESRLDPSFQLLSSNRGRSVSVSSETGKGWFLDGEAYFISNDRPVFQLEPNQNLEPTSTPGAAGAAAADVTGALAVHH